jgi:hypothetical protein
MILVGAAVKGRTTAHHRRDRPMKISLLNRPKAVVLKAVRPIWMSYGAISIAN